MQTARACARPAGRGDHDRADMDTAPPHMAAQPQRRRQRPGGAADRTHTATEPPGAPFPSHSEPNGSFAAPPSTPHRPEASVEQHRTTIRRPRGLWRRMGDDRSHEMRAAGASDPSARAAAAAAGRPGDAIPQWCTESLAAPLDPTRRMAPTAPPLHGCRMHVPSAFPPAPGPEPRRRTAPAAGQQRSQRERQPLGQAEPQRRFYGCQAYVTFGIGLVHVCVIRPRFYGRQAYVRSGIGLVHVCVIRPRFYGRQTYVRSGIGLVHVCVIRGILRRGPPEGRAPPWAGPKTPVVCSQVMVGKRQVCARPTRALCQAKVKYQT